MTDIEAMGQGNVDARLKYRLGLSTEAIRAEAKALAVHHPQGTAYLRGVENALARPVTPAGP